MATLKDVAKEAGLTVTTVSRVLNNRGYISDNARKKVAVAMQKLNYQPNELARSLINKSSNTIGVIVPQIRHPYFSEMISCLEEEAYKKGYKVLLCNSKGKDAKIIKSIEICSGNRVSGIILFSGAIKSSIFRNLNIPVITMERFVDSGTASVECDNLQGGRLAASRLIDAGCRTLLYIGGIGTPMPADNRAKGMKEICKKRKITYYEVQADEEWFYSMDYMQILGQTLDEHPDIDGIFASSDVIAAQFLQICQKRKIDVPGKMKIVGFDDSFVASLTVPRLTTVRQPTREMAKIAIELLDESVAGESVAKRTVLPVQLIERETT